MINKQLKKQLEADLLNTMRDHTIQEDIMGSGEWLPYINGTEYDCCLEQDQNGEAIYSVTALDDTGSNNITVGKFCIKHVEIEEIKETRE